LILLTRGDLSRFVPNPKPRFLDPCREVLRFKPMALRTEESDVDWIRRYLVFHRVKDGKRGRAGSPLPAVGRAGVAARTEWRALPGMEVKGPLDG